MAETAENPTPVEIQPVEPEKPPRSMRWTAVLGLALLAVIMLGTKSGAVQNAWRALTGNNLPLAASDPQPAGLPALSEHEREWIESLPPQQQMEALVQSAIQHEEGATELIARKLDSWQDQLENTSRWTDLMMTALYSNDLRVRAAAMEINLVAHRLEKDSDTVDSLIQKGQQDVSSRPYSAWMLGMLANRGVSPDRITAVLEEWMRDPNEQSRVWAIEGLANIGTDETVKDFLWVFKNDQSLLVRERAGCSLSKSGMLTRVQRMRAVPGLIDLAEESSLDDRTKTWVYQALREITDERLGNDPSTWRTWWLEQGQDRIQKFASSDGQQVLGNS